MRALYAEAGIEILERLLRDRDRDVLLEALGYLEDHPDPRFKDILLRIYENQTGVVAGRCAFLLGRLKDERFVSAYKRKINTREIDYNELYWSINGLGELGSPSARAILRDMVSEVEGEVDPYFLNSLLDALINSGEEISFLMSYYAKYYNGFALEILQPLASVCGSWYSVKDLQEEGERKTFKKTFPPVVSESLSYLKEKGLPSLEESLQKAYRKEDYRQVIEIARGYVEKRAEPFGIQDIELALSQNDSPPLANYKVIKAFSDFLQKIPQEALKDLALVAIVVLSRFVEFQNLLRLKIEELSEERLFEVIFEDRGTIQKDEELIKRLLTICDWERIFLKSIRQLRDHPFSFGTKRALRLLGELKDERAIPELVNFLKTKANDEALDQSIKTLVRIGEPLIDYLEKYFDELEQEQRAEILFALQDLPMERTADLLLRYWDKLWSMNKEPFLYALQGVTSRRFIDPLRKELKEGEVLEEEIFYLLCHIHGVDDILLPQIERRMTERRKEIERKLALFDEGGSLLLQSKKIPVELRCLRCGKPYHYDVENIYVTGEKAEPKIVDKIVCKNCRAINQYEMTPKGRMAILGGMTLTTALIKEGRLRPEESPIKVAEAGLMDGRRMSFEEVLKYYQNEVQKSPEDPALRVGYGNVLMRMGMEKEAVFQYQEALRLDPLAVEAYASLGEYEGDKGRHSQAYEYFKKAAEVYDTGHCYRAKETDQLKEAIFLNLERYENLLGIGTKQSPSLSSEPLVKREKVGRNDPCPCGSGKKYKKCCLIKEEARRSQKTSAIPTEIELREKLLSFSAKERFKKDLKRAYQLFWRKPFKEPFILDEAEEASFGFFLDWFIHDFNLSNGMTVIEEYYQQKKDEFSKEELSLLNYEMASYLGLYEVVSVTPEVGLRLRDLITEEEIDVLEVKGSLKLVSWDVIFARVIRMDSVNKLSGMITIIPRRSRDEILSAIRQTWERTKEETMGMTWANFMKANAHLLHHLIEDRSAKEPIFVTEENHRLISSKAVYEVKDFHTVKNRLNKEFDFLLSKDLEGKEIRWSWLKRGRSKDWEEGHPVEGAVIFRSEMVSERGKLRWTSLGTVSLTPEKLELWCISRERLEKGKRRLLEILGDNIEHRVDTYEDLFRKAMDGTSEISDIEETETEGDYLPLISEMMKEWITEWVDEEIPALNGMTPREAVRTPEGRKKVEELLKDFENIEERKRREGKAYVDINVLRKRLDL